MANMSILESDVMSGEESLSFFSLSEFNLRASDPRELLNLCASLGELDAIQLQKKVNNYIQCVTGAKTAFIINLVNGYQEAVIQVVGGDSLEQEYRISLPDSVLNQAVETKQPTTVQISEVEKELLRILSNQDISTFLSIPIENIEGNIVLLCCLVDFFIEGQAQCETLVTECFRYCVGTIVNTLAYEEQKKLHNRCHSLLSGAKKLISNLGDLTDLLREVMTEARSLTNAERCSLFLLDEEGNLVAKVFDGVRSSETLREVKIKAGQGIAGYVARTGTLLNIKDAYSHPLFFKDVDRDTGFRTRNILCFPIVDEEQVVGVAQLCNKMDANYFDMFDEEVATAFSVYCGISIMHSLVYKRITDAQARNKLSNELMMYHMKVDEKEVENVIEHKTEIEYFDIGEFSFIPREIPIQDTSSLAFIMFEDMGFIQHFHIPVKTLARFIKYAKKGYRDMPYHNWSHAFSVLHFVYVVLKNTKLIERNHLTHLEGLALLVSAMCHDIDHRGTTNQFQLLQDNNSLAKLYSSEGSVMERHHVSQTMCILNTNGCNIVEHLDESVFKQFINYISEIILATDLVAHFRILSEQKQMAAQGYDSTNQRHRYLLRSMLISCADFSDQTKNFELSRKVAVLIYEEFFKQGDLEKAMGVNPSEMMDREKANIPQLQVGFLSGIVLPVFQVLASLYPETAVCSENVQGNLQDWRNTLTFFNNKAKLGRNSIDILSDSELDESVKNKRESRK